MVNCSDKKCKNSTVAVKMIICKLFNKPTVRSSDGISVFFIEETDYVYG